MTVSISVKCSRNGARQKTKYSVKAEIRISRKKDENFLRPHPPCHPAGFVNFKSIFGISLWNVARRKTCDNSIIFDLLQNLASRCIEWNFTGLNKIIIISAPRSVNFYSMESSILTTSSTMPLGRLVGLPAPHIVSGGSLRHHDHVTTVDGPVC